MRKVISFSLLVPALLLTIIPAGKAYSQQDDGVFTGRGRVARHQPHEDRSPELRGSSPEDLKPLASPGFLHEIESLEQQCLEEINQLRVKQGLRPLEFSESLLPVARAYSQRMADEKFFSHDDPDGRTVRQRVSQAGIKWRMLGENLSYSRGYVNPVAASVMGWMDSPGHRRNILDRDFRQTAIGAWINENGTVYFTEIFLTR